MFNESWPWKRDLAMTADRLEQARLGIVHELGDLEGSDDVYAQETETVYRIERDVMSGTFAVRRLIGMPSKVTKKTRATKAAVTRFPLRDGAKAPDLWDALGNLDMYDTDTPQDATISVNALCNLFVHSLILRLAWEFDDIPWSDYSSPGESDLQCNEPPTKLTGLLVASDKSSAKHLTLVKVTELVRIFRIFANDEVTRLVGRRDRHGRMHMTAL